MLLYLGDENITYLNDITITRHSICPKFIVKTIKKNSYTITNKSNLLKLLTTVKF